MQNIINIFTAPAKAFESLNEKPSWLLPFIISVVFAVGLQYLVLDIGLEHQIAVMEAKDMTEQQIDAARQQMDGFMKYIGMIISPIGILIWWAIVAGILLGTSKISISEGLNFKKTFSIVAWSSLVTLVGGFLVTMLVYMKGTVHGVVLDLSLLMDTPPLGESQSLMYRILGKFDPFTIWQLVLWAIGLSVMGKVDVKKAAIPVVVLWIVWIVISIGFATMFEGFGM